MVNQESMTESMTGMWIQIYNLYLIEIEEEVTNINEEGKTILTFQKNNENLYKV